MPTIRIVQRREFDAPAYGEHLDIDEIKRLCERAGSHFFEPQALRFFRGRVNWQTFAGSDGWYFVTSEQFRGSNGHTEPRRYTVRRVWYRPNDAGELIDVEIDTVGEFQAYPTLHRAVKVAHDCARGKA